MNVKKEVASNKVINTLSRQIKSEIKEVTTRLDNVDNRLNSIDENLAQHMRRTALLESNQDRVLGTLNRLDPLLEDLRAAKKAFTWIYKPIGIAVGSICMVAIGAEKDLIIEFLKKLVGG